MTNIKKEAPNVYGLDTVLFGELPNKTTIQQNNNVVNTNDEKSSKNDTNKYSLTVDDYVEREINITKELITCVNIKIIAKLNLFTHKKL